MISKKSYLILTLLLIKAFIVFGYCSENFITAGSRQAGMANTAITLTDAWSIFHNPAGMSSVNQPTIAFGYNNNFLLPELGLASFVGIIPTIKGAFGASAGYFGDKTYNEQKYSFGYSHILGNKVFAGIIIDYMHINLPGEFKNSNALAGELGILINPLNELNIGFHLVNPTGSSFNRYNDKDYPMFISSGLAWKEDNYLISSQVQLGKNQETVISAGAEIILKEYFAFRIGASNKENMRYTIGFGYSYKCINTDIAFMRHPLLGLSSSISVQLKLYRK